MNTKNFKGTKFQGENEPFPSKQRPRESHFCSRGPLLSLDKSGSRREHVTHSQATSLGQGETSNTCNSHI